MLFRFDPFDSLESFDKKKPGMLPMDAVRTDDEVFVYLDAPGFSPDDIELTVEKNAVTVEASRRWYDADQKTLFSERPQGMFRRQIQFGDNLDVDSLSASFENGVLQLTIPVAPGSTPRKIDITSTHEEKQLTTSS